MENFRLETGFYTFSCIGSYVICLFMFVSSRYAIIFVVMKSFALNPSDEMNINVELALCES